MNSRFNSACSTQGTAGEIQPWPWKHAGVHARDRPHQGPDPGAVGTATGFRMASELTIVFTCWSGWKWKLVLPNTWTFYDVPVPVSAHKESFTGTQLHLFILHVIYGCFHGTGQNFKGPYGVQSLKYWIPGPLKNKLPGPAFYDHLNWASVALPVK